MEDTRNYYIGIETQEMNAVTGEWKFWMNNNCYQVVTDSEDCEKNPQLLTRACCDAIDSFFKSKYDSFKPVAEELMNPNEFAHFDDRYLKDVVHRYVVTARVCPEADEYRANGGSDDCVVRGLLLNAPAAVVEVKELVASVAKRVLIINPLVLQRKGKRNGKY